MTLPGAIDAAERILSTASTPSDGLDPRWQAIIRIGDFAETDPDEVWVFAAKWGCTDDEDLRMAISTCLVEHLLEHHFDRVFPNVEQLAMADRRFARAFLSCWQFGQSETSANARAVRALRARCEQLLSGQ